MNTTVLPRWLQLAAVLLFVVALRAPFLNQAVQGDDVYYINGAQYALTDPLHPSHARYAFEGDIVDMRGHPHPPLNVWVLTLLLAVFGDVREIPFHAVYMIFSLAAAAAAWFLARRFSTCATLAALLTLVVPPFMVSGSSLESDLPLLAFFSMGLALFIYGVDRASAALLGASALGLGLAVMSGYQAVLAVPILLWYLWLNNRKQSVAWLVAAVPLFVAAAWQLYDRISSGSLPATVLNGYLQHYGFWDPTQKAKNALGLIVHTGWILCPPLAVAAFGIRKRAVLISIAAAMVALMFLDANPLFWLSWGIGAAVAVWCLRALFQSADADERFLAGWVVLFLAGAFVIFFAGSARYLLPMSAPVAILAARRLSGRRGWLIAGVAVQGTFSIALGVVNYQHWNGYRAFENRIHEEVSTRRTWVSAEWGMRFYAETDGALPLVQHPTLRASDMLVSSALSVSPVVVPGFGRAVVASAAITPTLPFRLIGVGTKSAFSSCGFGLRAFDISTAPLDHVTAEILEDRAPTVSWLPMNSPAAQYQILSGVYNLENNEWRWMGPAAVFRLKAAPNAAPLAADLYIPPQAVGSHVRLILDERLVAEGDYPISGKYRLAGPAQAPASSLGSGAVTVRITSSKTFQPANDGRQLGIVLNGVGFAIQKWGGQ